MGISVLIAGQERTFVEALAARLDAESDITLVGALRVKTPVPCLTDQTSADILVVDGDLRGGDANRLCEEASRRAMPTRVIILSSSSGPTRIVQAIRSGAAAWVRKDESIEHLLRVIRGVVQGEAWLPPATAGNVVRLLLREQERRDELERLLALLTPRERAVLDCLAEGAGHRDAVAEQLHLSVNTVRTHLQNLTAKLGVHSALEAVALTEGRAGWLPHDADSAFGYPHQGGRSTSDGGWALRRRTLRWPGPGSARRDDLRPVSAMCPSAATQPVR
jgi:DNA-binding NarL/FixJ family response regulator